MHYMTLWFLGFDFISKKSFFLSLMTYFACHIIMVRYYEITKSLLVSIILFFEIKVTSILSTRCVFYFFLFF